VTDGDPATRWAVSRADRPRPDSWLTVDLGAEHQVDRVRLSWETAFGAEYRVQVSTDGQVWRDATTVPAAQVFTRWVNVDDRTGFVVRSANPIRVTATSMTLAAGPAAPLVAVGYPAQRATRTAALAREEVPTVDVPGVVAAVVDGRLCVFNLTAQPVQARVRVRGRTVRIGLATAVAEIRKC
jgi:hypothetical protein